jgi:putative transposase
MKSGRFSEEQIVGIWKRYEAGQKAADLAREVDVREATIYTWKSKYGGLEVNEAQGIAPARRGEPAAEALGGRSQPG